MILVNKRIIIMLLLGRAGVVSCPESVVIGSRDQLRHIASVKL